MSQICQKAADEFRDFALKREGGIGGLDRQTVLEYAYALVQKYGQASGELACMFYEQIAEAQNVIIPPAEMAALPEFGEVAKAVNGAIKQTEKNAPGAVERLTKQVGADTMLQNAKRDGAYFAWVTAGDTCAYCMMMSAIGWQKAGKNTLNGNHAEHIHAHCDCQYVVDFKGDLKVDGYDPEGMQKDIMQIADPDGGEYGGDFNSFLKTNGRQSMKTKRNGLKALRRYTTAKKTEDDMDWMSNSLNPRYGNPVKRKNENGTFELRKITNSKFNIYAETGIEGKHFAVTNTAKALRHVKDELPDFVKIPDVYVVDFAKLDWKAAGGYDSTTNILYINSNYDTKEKLIEFLTIKPIRFSNTRPDAVVFHEMGHKYYYDLIEHIANKKSIVYNDSKQIVDDIIRHHVDNTYNMVNELSIYATNGFTRGKYTEVVAESLGVKRSNEFAGKLIKALEEVAYDEKPYTGRD